MKKLDIHTLTEELLTEEILKEICRRARMYTAKLQTEEKSTTTTTSYNSLQDVLDDIFQEEETLQALSLLNQESIEEPIEVSIEETPTIKQESDLPDFQTLMELSIDNEELTDDMLVNIPYDYAVEFCLPI